MLFTLQHEIRIALYVSIVLWIYLFLLKTVITKNQFYIKFIRLAMQMGTYYYFLDLIVF